MTNIYHDFLQTTQRNKILFLLLLLFFSSVVIVLLKIMIWPRVVENSSLHNFSQLDRNFKNDFTSWQALDGETIELAISGKVLQIEVAATAETKAKGLSNREQLLSDGMIFVYPQLGYPVFWMYETNFSLDLIWLKDFTVVGIEKSVPPALPQAAPAALPRYSPASPVNMVLEIAAGRADDLNIKPGDKVTFR